MSKVFVNGPVVAIEKGALGPLSTNVTNFTFYLL